MSVNSERSNVCAQSMTKGLDLPSALHVLKLHQMYAASTFHFPFQINHIGSIFSSSVDKQIQALLLDSWLRMDKTIFLRAEMPVASLLFVFTQHLSYFVGRTHPACSAPACLSSYPSCRGRKTHVLRSQISSVFCVLDCVLSLFTLVPRV